jgi:chromosomal replication initiator protein
LEAARAFAAGTEHALFLYGPPGVGKTHLLHSIEHELRSRRPEANVVRMAAEELIGRMLHAFRYDTEPAFQEHLNTIDVLLLDHVHFDARMQRTNAALELQLCTMVDRGTDVAVAASAPPATTTRIVSKFLVVAVGVR